MAALLVTVFLSTCARNGLYAEHYPTGQKHWECRFINGKKDGHETVWRRNGKKEEEGDWQEGLRHGKSTFFWPNGVKQTEGEFVQGVKHGLWSSWDAVTGTRV